MEVLTTITAVAVDVTTDDDDDDNGSDGGGDSDDAGAISDQATIVMVMTRCDRPLSTTMFPRGLIAAIRSIPFCCSNRRMNLFLMLMFIIISSLHNFYAFP